MTQLVFAFDQLFLSHPNDLKNLVDKNPKKVTERSFKERFAWAVSLYTNPRGIGWAHEPPALSNQRPPPTNRWTFVWSRLVRLLRWIVVGGAAIVINASNPALATPGKVLSQATLPLRALGAAGYGVGGCAGMGAIHTAISIFAVGSGLSNPSGWLDLFGSPVEVWSIQRFWRRGWHQLLRKVGQLIDIFLFHNSSLSSVVVVCYRCTHPIISLEFTSSRTKLGPSEHAAEVGAFVLYIYRLFNHPHWWRVHAHEEDRGRDHHIFHSPSCRYQL